MTLNAFGTHALHRSLRRAALAALVLVTVSCGGGGGSNGAGPGGGNNLGPSGLVCTTTTACYGAVGVNPVLCVPTLGPNTLLNAGDADYLLNSLNAIRANLGLTAFVRTAALDTFATASTIQLMVDHVPHAYFNANAAGDPAFTGGGAENQGPPNGWPANTTTIQIDEILACFMSEATAPAGSVKGHWETIVCPCYTKVGLGLDKDGAGALYLTIEFSE